MQYCTQSSIKKSKQRNKHTIAYVVSILPYIYMTYTDRWAMIGNMQWATPPHRKVICLNIGVPFESYEV